MTTAIRSPTTPERTTAQLAAWIERLVPVVMAMMMAMTMSVIMAAFIGLGLQPLLHVGGLALGIVEAGVLVPPKPRCGEGGSSCGGTTASLTRRPSGSMTTTDISETTIGGSSSETRKAIQAAAGHAERAATDRITALDALRRR